MTGYRNVHPGRHPTQSGGGSTTSVSRPQARSASKPVGSEPGRETPASGPGSPPSSASGGHTPPTARLCARLSSATCSFSSSRPPPSKASNLRLAPKPASTDCPSKMALRLMPPRLIHASPVSGSREKVASKLKSSVGTSVMGGVRERQSP